MFRSERWAPVRQLLQQRFKSWELPTSPNDATTPRLKILVLGVFLTDRFNLASHLARAFASSKHHQIEQRWAGVFGHHEDPLVRKLTRMVVDQPTDKFILINALLSEVSLEDYDLLIVTDDDIHLPGGFLDAYVALQHRLDFALAQPARALHSFFDHDITVRRPWLLGRETRFVEIGPVFSLTKAAFPHLLPFDTGLPMGWGLDLVWPAILGQTGLRMGIIDRISVDHSYRPQGVTYDRQESLRMMTAALQTRPHLDASEAHAVIRQYWFNPVRFG